MNTEIMKIEHVPFMGADLLAAQDSEGNVWAGARWMCDGIGLSKGQTDRQIANIQTDRVLSKGASNLRLPTNGGEQDVWCLRLDFVPLWLARVKITPIMEEETPDIADALEAYQLSAKDVLAAAFLPVSAVPNIDALSPELRCLINLEIQQKEQSKAIAAVNHRVDNISEIVSLDANAWREKSKLIIVKIAEKWGGTAYIPEVHKELYKLLEGTAHVNLKRRLDGRRQRMAIEGASKTTMRNLNNLDVIADDPKLVSIYLDLVKRLAIRWNINVQHMLAETEE